jgi:hypothetical protein
MHASTHELISTSARDISTTMAPIQSKFVASGSQKPPLSDSDESTKQLHRSTVSRRARGEIQSRKDYREEYGLFTRVQKQQLLKYIDDLTRRGLFSNHYNVRIFAYNICGKWPGKN